MNFNQVNQEVKFYKESDQVYTLKYEENQFQMYFSDSKVNLTHEQEDLATLEMGQHSLNLVTAELVINSPYGSVSVVPVNSRKWLISIQTESRSTQWSNYELNKFGPGWELISLDQNNNTVVGKFSRRLRGSKLGSLIFTENLSDNHKLFLSMVVGLTIQTRHQRKNSHGRKRSFDLASILTNVSTSPPAPRSYMDVCSDLNHPAHHRRRSLKDLFRSSP